MRSEPNPNLEAELRNDPAFRIAMLDAATEAKGMAVTFGRGVSKQPWMLKGGRSWSQAIEVMQENAGRDVFLVNNDSGSHLVEWGSAKNPPYGILRRAVRAVGMRLSESPKP